MSYIIIIIDPVAMLGVNVFGLSSTRFDFRFPPGLEFEVSCAKHRLTLAKPSQLTFRNACLVTQFTTRLHIVVSTITFHNGGYCVYRTKQMKGKCFKVVLYEETRKRICFNSFHSAII